MSKVQMLLLLKKKRLTAAAEEIFALFEQTIAELEEELSLSKEENERLQKLLDAVLQPQLRIHRAVFTNLFKPKITDLGLGERRDLPIAELSEKDSPDSASNLRPFI
ncbi:hypothetical protein NQZ68_014511 [Dissostichus eleginoides]|nr:hypothetical protein NQZ68_014511 [Dissostichus eleginoides]